MTPAQQDLPDIAGHGPHPDAPAAGTGDGCPVFVDESGRRLRWGQRVGGVVALSLLGYIGMVGASLVGAPWLTLVPLPGIGQTAPLQPQVAAASVSPPPAPAPPPASLGTATASSRPAATSGDLSTRRVQPASVRPGSSDPTGTSSPAPSSAGDQAAPTGGDSTSTTTTGASVVTPSPATGGDSPGPTNPGGPAVGESTTTTTSTTPPTTTPATTTPAGKAAKGNSDEAPGQVRKAVDGPGKPTDSQYGQ